MKLLEAEHAHQQCKALLARGIDPNEQKRSIKAETQKLEAEATNTFEKVALEWLGQKRSSVLENTNTIF